MEMEDGRSWHDCEWRHGESPQHDQTVQRLVALVTGQDLLSLFLIRHSILMHFQVFPVWNLRDSKKEWKSDIVLFLLLVCNFC